MTHKLVIIGSGPAGWTASIYAARANLKPIIYEGRPSGTELPGGQLMFTNEVENFPAFPEGITGPELMERMKKQAQRFHVHAIMKTITSVQLNTTPFTLSDDEDNTIHSHSIIIATGARAKWLGIENELRLAQTGGGVSACAVCDGALPIFKNKELAVVGGGDTALEEALYLTQFAKKVHIIHRRDQFRASKILQERVHNSPLIHIYWNTQINKIIGNERIEALELLNTSTQQISKIPIGGLFVAIGHIPNTGFLKGQIHTDNTGYIITQKAFRTNTNIDGVFAAGDVIDPYYRQAITSAGTGCMAALDAERWLVTQGIQ